VSKQLVENICDAVKAFHDTDHLLSPGSSTDFLAENTEIDRPVEECVASVIEAGAKNCGPGIDVKNLRNQTVAIS
jgi:hypothetical protein